jgi:hypothetical protein
VLNHAAQPHQEIIDTLLLFARGILKLPKQLLYRGCPHVVFANPKVLITFDASFTLSLLTTADTISGGTALDNTSSAIMSSYRTPPPLCTIDQRPRALSFTFINNVQSSNLFWLG